MLGHKLLENIWTPYASCLLMHAIDITIFVQEQSIEEPFHAQWHQGFN